jgi:quinol monooxygenase YgiN
MEYDLEFSRKIECSEDDKRACMKTVSFLLGLAKKARTYGMLALAQAADETSPFLLRKGIQLATDGAKPDVVRSVLEFYILSGNYTGRDLLERCLILEGVLAIQDGLHPKLLKELLLSFFGEADYQTFEAELAERRKDDLDDYIKGIEKTEAASLNAFKLSNVVLKLDQNMIEELLKEMSTEDLAKSTRDMTGKAKIKILKSMQKKGALALIDTYENMESLSKAKTSEAQQQLVNTLSDLKKQERI